jgi:hypothetical protein
MAVPSNTLSPLPNSHEYAFVPTTATDYPAGPARGLWVQHSATTTITVITPNGDSVVVGIGQGMAYLPLRTKQISVNASSVVIVALY